MPSPPLERCAPLVSAFSSPLFLAHLFTPTCLFTAPTLVSFLLNFTALQRQGHPSGLAHIPQPQRVPPRNRLFPTNSSTPVNGDSATFSQVPGLPSSGAGGSAGGCTRGSTGTSVPTRGASCQEGGSPPTPETSKQLVNLAQLPGKERKPRGVFVFFPSSSEVFLLGSQDGQLEQR